MDQAGLISKEAALRRARREYVWFAIALLCITTLAAIKSHS
jgi:hypothetical protein